MNAVATVESKRASPAATDDEDDGANIPVFDDEARPLIPDGIYQAVCVKARMSFMHRFRRSLVILWLDVATGEHAGVRLERFLNVGERVGRGSDYFHEWTLANDGEPPSRKDRMAPSKFRGKLFEVEVVTVCKDSRGKARAEPLRYSKVARIIRLLVTNEACQAPAASS